ncbi:class I SAM-dependent methyltransferase [Geomesophilobacter sediminis]|uniref:Methyltransferase domain-containing protein n=1 Tax=Geomesophilobacter sediminis TaxID=2798584 RepID=A0A8J7JD35_9BACT|nr:class I SAM-dependent methyltransferase [Geomesophilobacter sediminis]MBJ6724913.1 methyltransferase domain-containing protein [Geomesophilobacter sediminis]
MTHRFKDHFSQVSAGYRSFRPSYPDALFQWLAGLAPGRDSALDCGCGTGQAALALARHFAAVVAVDPSAEQIANAVPDPKVTYRVAPAEATGVAPQSQDLVIAAQALHWFDLERFYPEVRRVARPEGIFAAFSYGLMTVDRAVDRVVGELYYDILGGFWPPERCHVDEGYRSLPFPFREIEAPPFAMSARWEFPHLMGYLATWSAVKEYQARVGADPLAKVRSALEAAWSEGAETKDVFWPLVIRAGSVN